MPLTEHLTLNTRSENILWTDAHIAQNMLAAHLDYENDAASRNLQTIKKTVHWINSVSEGKRSLLDLGCGPGIYANQFSAMGYAVTGIDISENSIQYAKNWAEKEGNAITYFCKDYVKEEIEGKFDIATCIYCDFGALLPTEEKRFLENIHHALNKDGILIFDVFGRKFGTTRKETNTWSFSAGPSFWCPNPHFILEENIHFADEMAWGRRVFILEADKAPKEYILWDYYFDEEKITALLRDNGFLVEMINKALISENEFTSNDVMMIKARKV